MKTHSARSITVKGLAVFLLIQLAFFTSQAQPSGGPYGPIRQNYQIPKVQGKLFYVAPDGKTDADGATPDKPTNIETAISQAKTGDAIILRGGTYRTGDLEYNQGITLQPYADEQPVFKGTNEAKDWKAISGGLWKTSWTRFFEGSPDDWWRRDRFGMETPLHIFNNDMVFVDGRLLKSVGWEGAVDSTSFYIDYKSGFVYIGSNPTNHLVEITAFKYGMHRLTKDVHGKSNDKKGPAVRGITFTQYAFCAFEIDGFEPQAVADPSTFGKDAVGTVIENCTFSYCGRVGAFLRGDNTILRNCSVHHTTTEGVYLLSSSDCLLEKNIFSQNNIENIIGYYPAAVKIFNQTHRVTCRDNLIYDLPISNGIWYDVGNVDGRFLNNWVEGVGNNTGSGSRNKMWPSNNGFFFEISKGVICAGNVFVNCDHGIMILNSCNAQIYQNTLVNSTVCIGRDTRSAVGDHFGWHPSTGPDVDQRFGHVFVNNLLTSNNSFKRPLMIVWQPAELCDKLTESPLKQYDFNVYVRGSENGYKTMVYWSPVANKECQQAVETISDLQKVSGASAHSAMFNDSNMPLFKSSLLGNYQVLPSFAGTKAATPLPAEIQNLLGITEKTKPYIGAFPVYP